MVFAFNAVDAFSLNEDGWEVNEQIKRANAPFGS
jgi:hypothetical protein